MTNPQIPDADNAAFVALAAPALPVELITERTVRDVDGVAVTVAPFPEDSAPVRQLLAADAEGILDTADPAVLIRVHPRGSSTLVTGLGSAGADDGLVLSAIRRLLAGELPGGADPAAAGPSRLDRRGPARAVASRRIPADELCSLAGDDEGPGSPEEKVADVLAALLATLAAERGTGVPAMAIHGDGVVRYLEGRPEAATPRELIAAVRAVGREEPSAPPAIRVRVRRPEDPPAGCRILVRHDVDRSGVGLSVDLSLIDGVGDLAVRVPAEIADPDELIDSLLALVETWARDPGQALAVRPDNDRAEGDEDRWRVLRDAVAGVLDAASTTPPEPGDNFFALGGDSMTALLLANELARRGWCLDVQDVFLCADFGALAGRMRPAVEEDGDHPAMTASGLGEDDLAALRAEFGDGGAAR